MNRKLVLKMSVSVDGFVCGPNGEIDWIFKTSSEESTKWIVDMLHEAGAHLMGSRTYHDMAAFWPYSDLPFAPPMNDLPKIIFSRHGLMGGKTTRALADAKADHGGKPSGVTPTAATLTSWAEPEVASGDLADEIRRLKAQPGKFLLAHGGARFAQSLATTGLIDEYRLVIHPVVLGRGEALFSALSTPMDLRLVNLTRFGSGVVAAVYQSAGL